MVSWKKSEVGRSVLAEPRWTRILRAKINGILISAGLCFAPSTFAALGVGQPLPALNSFALEGTVPATGQGQVTLVDFWASWCGPCKVSFPALNGLNRDFSAKGLVIVGVSVDESRGDYEVFLKRLKPPFATARDAKHKLVEEVSVPAMPTSYLVDKKGVVRFIHVGFHEETEKQLRAEIAALLEEKL